MSAAVPIDIDLLRSMPLPALPEESDKRARGVVLVVAGGRRVPGAPLLSGPASLRVGAGKLKLAATAPNATPLGVAAPEAAVVTVDGDPEGEIGLGDLAALAKVAREVDAVVIGPGMMGDGASKLAAALAAAAPDARFVVDAAALDGLLDHLQAQREMAGRLVLTPHAGEMAKLIDWPRERVRAEPRTAALGAARQAKAVVALKGETTFVAAPDGRLWVHAGGVVGLGTSGSGDVLAGAIGGLLARGATPEAAAIRGVFIHGLAGRNLSRSVGEMGFLAREIVDALPAALAASQA